MESSGARFGRYQQYLNEVRSRRRGRIAYYTSQRINEIGVRIALGAQPGDILKLVLGKGLLLVAAGVGLGLVGAFAITRGMEAWLYDVSPADPVAFGAAALLLGGVALLACYLPARRAMRVDPMVALRHD